MAKNKKHVAPSQLERADNTGGVASPFVTRSQIKATGIVTVNSMSPILKPLAWPKDESGKNLILIGVLKKIVHLSVFEGDKKKKEIDRHGYGAEIVPAGAPVGVVVPVTATLKTGLDATFDDENETATSPAVGKVVEIELLPERIKSKKGQAAWHFVVAIHDTPPTLALN